MNQKQAGVILLLGVFAFSTACGRGDVAPPPETPPPETPKLEPSPRDASAAIPTPTPPTPGYETAARRELTSHDLDRFLEVREKMFEIYTTRGVSEVLARWIVGVDMIEPGAAGDAELNAILDRFNSARFLGLAEAGMHEIDYARVEQVVYGEWWKATAGDQDIDRGIEHQQVMLRLADDKLSDPSLSDVERRGYEVRRARSERRLANLSWTRTREAAQALQELPAGTRGICSDRAEEIRRLEMLPLEPYAELFSVSGLRPISIAQR